MKISKEKGLVFRLSMDYNIYLIVSEDDLKKIGIIELKAEWEGR